MQMASVLKVGSVRGFTIIELMIGLLIIGIVVGVGAPALNSFVNKQNMIAQTKRFRVSLVYARTQATSQSRDVFLCSSDDGASCLGSSTWDRGWIIWVERTGNQTPDFGTGSCLASEDCLLKVEQAVAADWSLRADANFISFGPQGERGAGSAQTFELCGEDADAANDDENSRTITIAGSGSSSVSYGTTSCPTT